MLKKEISFAVTREDAILIAAIVEKAVKLKAIIPSHTQNLNAVLTVIHVEVCPLDLVKMFVASSTSFVVEINDICAKFDGKTGNLAEGFTPLFALKNGNGWVYCADHLPDSDLTVMTYGLENDEPVWPGYHDGEQWWDISGCALPERCITHWQPFPEPPKD